MITFKPVVLQHQKRQDGTFNVKVRVTFRGKSKYIATNIVCSPADLTRSCKIKNGTIQTRCNEIVGDMRKAVADLSSLELEYKDIDYIVAKIKESHKKGDFRLDFFQFGEEYIKTKTESTRRAYSCALNTFERFLGKRSIDINQITKTMLVEFMAVVDQEKKMHFDRSKGMLVEGKTEKISKGASTRHVMKLAHIFNAAKDKYNDEDSDLIFIPRSPFAGLKLTFPKTENEQKPLTPELMQEIISYKTEDRSIRKALDMFVLSFLLMGANLADLHEAKVFEGNVWIYNRKKTRGRRNDNAEMRVQIPEQAGKYVAGLKTGRRSSYWLPALHEYSSNAEDMTRFVNKELKRWCRINKDSENLIKWQKLYNEEYFTFYASRKTWATTARRAKIEKSLVDECIAHKGDFAMTDIYAERNWTQINEANSKVIAMFVWD